MVGKGDRDYLLTAPVIHRIIGDRCNDPPTLDVIEQRLGEVAETLKGTVIEGFSDTQPTKAWSASKKRRAAEDHTETRWHTLADRLAVVSGKAVLGSLARWSKAEFNVSFGSGTIISSMTSAEISSELRVFLERVERCAELAPGLSRLDRRRRLAGLRNACFHVYVFRNYAAVLPRNRVVVDSGA